MSQRGRGHFPKDRTVNRSEPSKVRELVMLSNLRDTCCRRISTSQRGEEHAIAPHVHLHPARLMFRAGLVAMGALDRPRPANFLMLSCLSMKLVTSDIPSAVAPDQEAVFQVAVLRCLRR